jgi:hypothetical protein
LACSPQWAARSQFGASEYLTYPPSVQREQFYTESEKALAQSNNAMLIADYIAISVLIALVGWREVGLF